MDWKRRDNEDRAAEAEAVALEKASLWKKELSFKRRPKDEQAPAVEAAAPAVEPADDIDLTWLIDEPPAETVAEVEPEPEVVLPPLTEPVAEAAVDAPTVELPPVTGPELPPAPQVPTLEPALVADVDDAASSISPIAAPEPVVEEDAPPPAEEPAPAKKPPLHKREISFKRKPKAKPAREAKRKPERSARAGKKVVGLKIGASQIAAARVANGSEHELVQLARAELAPGIVVGGELRDPEALTQALKDFFSKHKLPKRGVRLGIANNRIGVRTFEIAGIADPKQLANAIRFRAQEALPIPIEEAVLDWQILEERQAEDGTVTRRVLLVVAYRDLVDRYVAACRNAGITLVGIDLEAFAMLRALAPERDEDASEAALVAVSIGHERSTFAVSDGRVCEFTRVLDWGGSALDVAIARALDLAPSEAEAVKRAVSLAREEAEPAEEVDADQVARAKAVIRTQVQSFARELVSSLQFYQAQPGSLGIGEIVVTGGTAHLPGLAEELQRLIGVSVRVGDPLARVKLPKKLEQPAQVGSLAVAIGLGIEV
jgi:type IV pilus assembly protein PilM